MISSYQQIFYSKLLKLWNQGGYFKIILAKVTANTQSSHIWVELRTTLKFLNAVCFTNSRNPKYKLAMG
jgi:hypothetical protein